MMWVLDAVSFQGPKEKSWWLLWKPWIIMAELAPQSHSEQVPAAAVTVRPSLKRGSRVCPLPSRPRPPAAGPWARPSAVSSAPIGFASGAAAGSASLASYVRTLGAGLRAPGRSHGRVPGSLPVTSSQSGWGICVSRSKVPGFCALPTPFFLVLFCLFCFFEMGFHYPVLELAFVHQAGLELREPPFSSSRVLGFKVCAPAWLSPTPYTCL